MQVKEWLLWAVKEYNLVDVDLKKFASTDGYKLCQMTMRDMCRLTSKGSSEILIANLTYLKQSKYDYNKPVISDIQDSVLKCSYLTTIILEMQKSLFFPGFTLPYC